MKKLLILPLLLAFTAANAQWGSAKQQDCQAIKNRTLIVVVEETNANLVKKLDPDEKDFYNKEVDEYNAMMKQLMPKYWKYNDKVIFKTRSEVEQLVKSKSKDYAYMEDNKFTSNYANHAALKATMKIQEGKTPLFGSDYSETAICIRLTDDNPNGNPVYGIYLPSAFPTSGQMVYGLKQLELYLQYKNDGKKELEINKLYKENAKNLASKTLLIDKDETSLTDAEIKKYYPFPYQLVDKAKIDSAFLNEESNYVTFVFIPRAGNKMTTMVVTTGDGTEMARTDNSWNKGVGISFGGIADQAAKQDATMGTVRKDDLKYIAKEAK